MIAEMLPAAQLKRKAVVSSEAFHELLHILFPVLDHTELLGGKGKEKPVSTDQNERIEKALKVGGCIK